jgi:hypothetical protein
MKSEPIKNKYLDQPRLTGRQAYKLPTIPSTCQL